LLKYYRQKKQENPKLTDEQIAQDYEETRQGKQATHVYWEDRGATGRRV